MFKSTDPDKPYFHCYVFLFFTPISTSKKMFFSERELKKALSSAVWTLVIFDWFVLSMRMQVILDSLFTHPGSAPIRGGKKGEFRDWTNQTRIPASVNSKLFNLLIPFSFFLVPPVSFAVFISATAALHPLIPPCDSRASFISGAVTTSCLSLTYRLMIILLC